MKIRIDEMTVEQVLELYRMAGEAMREGIKDAGKDPDNEITRAVEGYVRSVLENMDTFGPVWP